MNKIAAVLAILVLSGMAITGAIVAGSNAAHNSIEECQRHQQQAIEAYGPDATHQFAASCLSKNNIWYDVYYEAQEPDLALEVELCEMNLVP